MTEDVPDARTETDARSATTLGGGGAPVELRGVSKEFEDVTAVDGIDLTVEPGELLVLLGPSGCGKTTTLRMIAGLETVSTGSISIGGDEVTETLPQRRDVSMVFQNYALYPHKTVRGNLRFPLGKTDLNAEEKRQRVEEVADLLEISPHLSKDPDQLSGGQRQRVALGRTIIREPRLFLMDEPLSNLDATLRVQTRAQIRDLQKRLGTTTIYVTHDQEEALSIADRLVIMNDGKIEQIGSPEAVYTTPVNEFVAEFLGEPSMNILDVTTNGDGVSVLFPEDPIRIDELGLDLPPETTRIGIRPEDIDISPIDALSSPGEDGSPATPAVSMTVGVVEPLGHGYEATVHRGAVTMSARTDTFENESGDEVAVTFDANRLQVFDRDGRTL